MLFAHEYGPVHVVDGGSEITQRNAHHFRTRVELGLAACDRVVVDLRCTEQFDGWGFLTLLELVDDYRDRLAFVAPHALCSVLTRNGARCAPAVYERIDDALAASGQSR